MLHKQENFPQKYVLDQEVFHKQGSLPQTKNFSWSRKFSTVKKILHKQRFSIVNKNFCKQRSKRPSGSQNYRSIQYWFLCKNIFNFLMFVGNKRSYIRNWTISFLSTCELSLLSIKSLILYKVLTECT